MSELDAFVKSLAPGKYTINSKTCKCVEVLDSEGNQLFFETEDSGIDSSPLAVEDPRPYGKQLEQSAATTLSEKDHIINTMRTQRNKLRFEIASDLEWAKKMFAQGKIGRLTAQRFLDRFNSSNRDRRLIWPLPAIVTFEEAFGEE